MNWTDENVAILKTMWADGATYSEIGARFGISRCAISGKVHRLGLACVRQTDARAQAACATKGSIRDA
jgi:hypothetical protein